MIFRGTLSAIAILPWISFSGHAADTLKIVSAASYTPAVAPNSIAVAFGQNLAPRTLSGQLDSGGNLPTVLDGLSAMVNQEPASLIYISQTQVSFVTPADLSIGTATVQITTASGGALTGTVEVLATVPAIFAADGSGKGSGAILNAVTSTPEPFTVETPQNSGTDKQTRLAVYATGLRYAGNPSHDPTILNVAANVTASGVSTSGAGFNFTVEYAGPAPGYPGLDQVNLVLPAAADTAGLVTLTLAGGQSSSNNVTFNIQQLANGAIRPLNLSLDKSTATGGDTVTGTVYLNAPARAGGFNVRLSSESAFATVPLSLNVPMGQVSTSFSLRTSVVNSVQQASISASPQSGSAVTAGLTIYPVGTANLASIVLNPASLKGGVASSGTITLTNPAPNGGLQVTLTSDNPAAHLPGSVNFSAGQTTAKFNISTDKVSTVAMATIGATLQGNTQSAVLTLNPALQLTLDAVAAGGKTAMGTLTLAPPCQHE